MNNKITVVCYGKKEVWNTRGKAIEYYREGIANSEGSERNRYASILSQLLSGQTFCSDEY